MHEEVALQAYIEKKNNVVAPTGLHLFQYGYLGCTPYVIVDSKEMPGPGALEMKCPFKYTDQTMKEIIQDEAFSQSKLKRFFLKEYYQLNLSHNY